MKKRMLCAALCLCLLCSVLVTPAMANHTCLDEDYDGWCDDCYEIMPHFCGSCDGDAYCDVCYEMMKHTCMFEEDYAICGKCFEPVEHDCVDADQDYMCDRCFAPIDHTCTDADGDYWCDLCYCLMDHTCEDADGDFYCDICDEVMEHDCIDTDADYYCDLCGYPVSHECVDTDDDFLCDICYDIVVPDDMFTTVYGTVKSGLDNLEPVYIDIYDQEDTYINFAILTGDEPEYEMMLFPQTSYNVYVSKANHVSRTYALDVADDAAALDIQLCPIGDASGDGRLNMGDIAKIYSHIRNTKLLTDEYALECADVSGDGKLNMGDTAKLYSQLRATSPLG